MLCTHIGYNRRLYYISYTYTNTNTITITITKRSIFCPQGQYFVHKVNKLSTKVNKLSTKVNILSIKMVILTIVFVS